MFKFDISVGLKPLLPAGPGSVTTTLQQVMPGTSSMTGSSSVTVSNVGASAGGKIVLTQQSPQQTQQTQQAAKVIVNVEDLHGIHR